METTSFEVCAIYTARRVYLACPNEVVKEHYGNHTSKLMRYLFDGQHPNLSFDQDWVWVEEMPKRFGVMVSQPDTNHRFELCSDKIEGLPKTIPVDEMGEEDWDCSFQPFEEYEDIYPLYQRVSDKQHDVFKEYKLVVVWQAEMEDDIAPMCQFTARRHSPRHDESKHYQTAPRVLGALDEIFLPPILHPLQQCALSSRQVYDVVRAHILTNIDPRYARVTSDYDFCLTVKKQVALHKPYSYQREVYTPTGRSYKRKRYREVYVKKREVTVFEMTWSPKCYEGYTPIKGIVADNAQELESKVHKMLNDLMDTINAPLADCPNCNGMGVIEKQ